MANDLCVVVTCSYVLRLLRVRVNYVLQIIKCASDKLKNLFIYPYLPKITNPERKDF